MNYTFGQFFKDFYIFLEGQRLKFFLFLILRYISEAIPFIIFFLIGLIISQLSQENTSLQLIYIYIGLIVVATIFQTILRFYSKYQLYKIGTIVRRNIRLLAMNQLLRLDLSWHEDQNTGAKIQKINSGTDEVEKVFHSIANDWMSIFTGATASIFIFFFINPLYSLFIFVMMVTFLLIYKSFMPRLMQLRKENQILKEKVNGTFTESAYSISSIKTLGLHSHISSKSQSIEEAYKEKSLETKRASQIRTVFLLSFASICAGIFLFWIVSDHLAGAFAIGMVLTYYTYFGRYLDAQHKGIWEIQRFIDAKVIFERLMTILGSQEFREQELGKKKITSWRTLSFTNVSFAYKQNITLSSLSFSIKKGEKIAFVGKTGSGKSTITKLLLQLYPPKSGSIQFDATLINDIKQSALTQKMTCVMQETELFQTSIEENIIAGSTKNSPLLAKVCQIAQLNPLIKKLPRGLQSLVGEKGVKLSGGERQRIAIARALYRNPEILIFDEATSALDSKTESAITTQIKKEYKNTTQIIIAHRLSTITHVDRIYVLEKGRIVEVGSHKELLKQKGKYYKLWKVQHKK